MVRYEMIATSSGESHASSGSSKLGTPQPSFKHMKAIVKLIRLFCCTNEIAH